MRGEIDKCVEVWILRGHYQRGNLLSWWAWFGVGRVIVLLSSPLSG